MVKDIFISYRNDGEGNNFAARLFEDLEKAGYSVYFNSHERRNGSFPDRLRDAISLCNDFLLILSNGCMEQLKAHNEVDWIREEILHARRCSKNIIPVLIGNTEMPKNKNDMPEDLRFLPDLDACFLPEQYLCTPFNILANMINSVPDKDSLYKNDFNNNSNYRVEDDFKIMLEKAEAGNVESMFYVACYYHNGIYGHINYAESSKWLNKILSTEQEPFCSLAHSMIADYYYRGAMPGEEQSYEKAYLHRQQASDDGNSKMQLAAMRRIGSGCEFDFNQIEASFNNVENGDSISKSEQAMFYITYGKFNKAIEIFESIDCLMPEAEYQLGLLYKLGVHQEPPHPDYIIAGYHLQNAADNGHVQAAYEFGMLNFNPTGKYKKDFKKAEKYFKIAADAGVAEAQYKLGWIYQNGLNGERNIEKSIEYNKMAATQGHIGAAGSLTLLYQEPGYINYNKAYKYAKQAADGGYANGAFRLANFLFLGKGCKADENEAYRYYKMAMKHGIVQAEYMIKKLESIK